jgi:hypothetical protein
MFCSSPARTAAAALLLSVVIPAAFAKAPVATLSQTDKERAKQLVERLGDRSFKVRESASAELVQMGRAVEPILRDGMNHPDPEIRQRCKRILPMALAYELDQQIRAFMADTEDKNDTPLAGWARFKELAGNDRGARLLFAELHRHDADFMETLAKNPAELRDLYQAKCQELIGMFNLGHAFIGPEQVGLLLFASFEPKLGADLQAQMFLSNVLVTVSYQPSGKLALRDNAAVRRLLVKHIEQANNSLSNNSLTILINLNLREDGLAIARKILSTSSAGDDVHAKAMAISLMGKWGTREDIPKVTPFLDDTTGIGAFRVNNNAQISTQLRDVALANLIKLSGDSIADYNFSYLKQFPQLRIEFYTSPVIWGFSDETSRTAAVNKWLDRWQKSKP